MTEHPLETPDGRYIVVRKRLWRKSDPNLSADLRRKLVSDLMAARRNVKASKGEADRLAIARTAVNRAKIGLGERGPVWWDDDAPDYTRYLIDNTPYADWFSKRS
jgi:hypothetical protein